MYLFQLSAVYSIILRLVSLVGKTTTGSLLAKKNEYRDKICCEILYSLIKDKKNKIIAVTPLPYFHFI